MKNVTFITGSKMKADYLSKLIGLHIEHVKVELDEIQSLNLQTVVKHKLHQAYAVINQPVLVEDVALEFSLLGRLPGTFIKQFQEELSHEELCRLLDGRSREAVAKCIFGYYDGVQEAYFEGSLTGMISEHPSGSGGYGWDPIFIPDGYTVTRAELSLEDDEKTYQIIKPISKVRDFLNSIS